MPEKSSRKSWKENGDNPTTTPSHNQRNMLPDDKAKAMVERVVNSQPLSQSNHDMMINVVEDLIERRKKHFAHYTADILDYNLTETEEEFRLSVVSFVRSDEDESEKE